MKNKNQLIKYSSNLFRERSILQVSIFLCISKDGLQGTSKISLIEGLWGSHQRTQRHSNLHFYSGKVLQKDNSNITVGKSIKSKECKEKVKYQYNQFKHPSRYLRCQSRNYASWVGIEMLQHGIVLCRCKMSSASEAAGTSLHTALFPHQTGALGTIHKKWN